MLLWLRFTWLGGLVSLGKVKGCLTSQQFIWPHQVFFLLYLGMMSFYHMCLLHNVGANLLLALVCLLLHVSCKMLDYNNAVFNVHCGHGLSLGSVNYWGGLYPVWLPLHLCYIFSFIKTASCKYHKFWKIISLFMFMSKKIPASSWADLN